MGAISTLPFRRDSKTQTAFAPHIGHTSELLTELFRLLDSMRKDVPATDKVYTSRKKAFPHESVSPHGLVEDSNTCFKQPEDCSANCESLIRLDESLQVLSLWWSQSVSEDLTCPSITAPHEKAMKDSQLALPTRRRTMFDGSCEIVQSRWRLIAP